MLDCLSKKQKIIFFIVLSIMIIFIIYYIYSNLYKNEFLFSNDTNHIDEDFQSEDDSLIDKASSDDQTNNSIIVYICGAVKESKVITLKENSRISDAIDMAGGLTKDADLTNVNLAYILEDGEKIYIPKKGEIVENSITSSSENIQTNMSKNSFNSSTSTKININKASQTELENIPGVGPSTALKIINYREENGKFSTIEDIKNVSGIGEAKYKKIKDYIKVK